jgi:hypothetical protein
MLAGIWGRIWKQSSEGRRATRDWGIETSVVHSITIFCYKGGI